MGWELAVSASAGVARFSRYWLSLPDNLRGILWLVVGAFLFVIVDVFVKTLGRTFDPFQLALFRYAVGWVVLAPVFIRMGWGEIATQHIGLHLTRMILAFAAQVGVFVTVIYMPLADATAFMFTKPLFTTIVAVFLIAEAVNTRRWIATLVGFVGVLVMVRPGSDAMDPVALVAVGAALVFAVANVLIRMLAKTEPPNRILFYYHVGGIVAFTGPAAWVWRTPVGTEWLLLIAIGAVTTAGMVCYIRAFSVGAPSAVGPAENLRLIYAALFGFFLFSEVPSVWTLIGAAIIVASTYYIARDEARHRPK
jgi:drug/metabolite transporter (DMT)-like permease